MRVRLVSKVHSDIESAMDYYVREAGNQIAREFYDEFQALPSDYSRILDRIRSSGSIRRINFADFLTTSCIKLWDEGYVKILVVKHDRREPDFGLDR